MIAQDIQYVMKDISSPNAPQIHPIENYWSILKQKVYMKTIGVQKSWSIHQKNQIIWKENWPFYLPEPVLQPQD